MEWSVALRCPACLYEMLNVEAKNEDVEHDSGNEMDGEKRRS